MLWVFAGSFWVLVLSRVVGGIASGNLSVATASIADVTSRRIPLEGHGFGRGCLWLGFILGPALGGWASTMDPLGSDAQGVFVLNEFSLAAVISLALGILNWAWLASRFKEALPLEKEGGCRRPQTGDFSDREGIQYRRSQSVSVLSFLHDFV